MEIFLYPETWIALLTLTILEIINLKIRGRRRAVVLNRRIEEEEVTESIVNPGS